jgi:flagellin
MIVDPALPPSAFPPGHPGCSGAAAGMAATARLDGILSQGRQLSSAKALLDVVRQVLEDVALMADEAARILGVLAEPGLPPASWEAATLRYQHAVHEVVGLLAASRNVGHMLLQGEDSQGVVAVALQRMERIAGLLPRAPADRHAAQQAAEGFAPVTRSLEEARSRLEEAHRSVEAQLAMALERMDDESAALGAMEDTDVLKEAARLQALQIRQQLAGQSIGLGALVPRCLQDLRHL